MSTPIFTGAGVALITPMNSDGSVNFDELGRLLEFQIENGTDAIIACGTTGEAATLSVEEHKAVLSYVAEKVNKRIPVIAGTGSNDTATAISLSKSAQKYGADGLLSVTPYYNKTSQAGLVKHFTTIADSVDLPIILYNVNGYYDRIRELLQHAAEEGFMTEEQTRLCSFADSAEEIIRELRGAGIG